MSQSNFSFILMIRQIGRLTHRLENFILVTLLALMILSGFAQLSLRNLFDYGLLWNDAFNKVLLLWTALLGALAATRHNRHIKISLLDRLLPSSMQSWYQRFLDLTSGLVCGFVAWYSLLFVMEEYTYGDMAFASVPLWLTESIIPATFSLMAMRYLMAVIAPSEKQHQ